MYDRGTTRELAANEILFRAGDESDSVFLIRSGTLQVLHMSRETSEPGGMSDTGDTGDTAETGDTGEVREIVVSTLGPGDVVGEITAVIGGRRTATVRVSDSPALVQELSAHEYADWLAADPDEARRIAELARTRIDHMRVARVLTELIGPGHQEVIDDVDAVLEWTRLDAGQRLFEQGDPADAAYIVVTGRIRLTAEVDNTASLDVSVGRGDIVGELGIIEQAPRSATATATRDSTLARLSEDAFAELTGKHPKLMLQVFRKIVTRVMRPSQEPPHAGMIAVAVTSPDVDPDLVRSLAAEIERHGTTLFLDREQVTGFFNRRGVVDARGGSAEQARLDEFLNEADVAHEWVVLETDPTLTAWSGRALRSADRALLITSPFPDDEELHRIREFTSVVDAVADRDLWLVQSNHRSILRPRINDAVVRAVRPDRIVQHHRGDPTSTARLGRLACGKGVGVALSGGGARAFAQIGALQALIDAGYDIDMVTGTSMGSVVGAIHAYLAGRSSLLDMVEEGFRDANIVDYTTPIVSLASGIGLTDAIEKTCGPILIEELTLPFVCLSTNLTRARLVEHRRGLVSHALRSSVSLPGVFPPVIVDGDLIVDGGVMENLPIGPLVRDAAVGTVIAVDVAPPSGPSSQVDYGTGVRGRQALFGQLAPNRGSYPGIANTVIASMLLSSARARQDALTNGDVDLYLSLNLKGVKMLDFDAIATVAERGYRATLDELEAT